MSLDAISRALFGPLGVVGLTALLTVVFWPVLRRLRARRRGRVVRASIGWLLLLGLLATWALPRPGAFGSQAFGRHAWLSRWSDPATGPGAGVAPTRTRMVLHGPGAFMSAMETGLLVVVAIGSDRLIRRRLDALARTACDTCGYDLSRIDSDRCPECGRTRPPTATPTTPPVPPLPPA